MNCNFQTTMNLDMSDLPSLVIWQDIFFLCYCRFHSLHFFLSAYSPWSTKKQWHIANSYMHMYWACHDEDISGIGVLCWLAIGNLGFHIRSLIPGLVQQQSLSHSIAQWFGGKYLHEKLFQQPWGGEQLNCSSNNISVYKLRDGPLPDCDPTTWSLVFMKVLHAH